MGREVSFKVSFVLPLCGGQRLFLVGHTLSWFELQLAAALPLPKLFLTTVGEFLFFLRLSPHFSFASLPFHSSQLAGAAARAEVDFAHRCPPLGLCQAAHGGC